MSDFPPNMTLAEAKAKLWDLIDDGHECPTCEQFAKVYRRKLNATMARALITLHRHTPSWGFFAHAPSLPGDTHEISQLAWWGLVAEESQTRPDGGKAGWWALTHKGQRFVRGEINVPSHARIYNGRCLNLTGRSVNIETCLGSRFNYNELMTEQLRVG